MVSIIIPTYNRAEFLEMTLESICHMDCDGIDFEVLVVDNASTDRTKDLAEHWIRKNVFSLRYVYEPIPGLLSGRHKGALEAKGNILSFIDDDVVLTSTWLKHIVKTLKAREDIDFLTGPCWPKYASETPSWFQYFWTFDHHGKHCGWLSLMDLGNDIKEIDPLMVWGLNFTIRRSAFDLLKGFNPDNIPKHLQHFQGDGETGLSYRAKMRGMKALYHPMVALEHQISPERLTIEYFEKRAFYQGVANSFSALKGYLNAESDKRDSTSYLMRKVIRKLKNLTKTNKEVSIPIEILKMKQRLNLCEQDGFDFHQRQYLENEKVKSWVEKSDYMDYYLPEN